MTKISWTKIESVSQLDLMVEKSFEQPILIYKHSTRCGFSNIVKSRLEHSWEKRPLNIDCYFLDLIAYRSISHEVEKLFQVRHQSPQVLLIVEGICTFHGSHMGVSYESIKGALETVY